MEKYNKRKSSQVCAMALTATMICSSVMSATANAQTLSGQKEEVVYVNTDSNGNMTGTYVVNIFTDKDVTDFGDYSEVRNMNTQDVIQYKDGIVTVQNSADKLYYEGTLENAEIPWNINISYKLDGVEFSPQELAGKSGKLDISMSVTENKNAKEGFFDNYAIQVILKLDNTMCKNIVSDGATVANVGNQKQFTYTIMPGKEKAIQVLAEVTDFEMESIAMNGVRLNLDIDRDSLDTSTLDDKIKDLQDAVKDLDDGAGDLNSGASDIRDGANDLYEGIDTINEALSTLNSKSDDLTSGSSQVKSALYTIKEALDDVELSTDELQKLGAASTQIQTGINSLTGGLQTLDGSIDTYYNSLAQAGLTDMNSFIDMNNQALRALGITEVQRELYSSYISGGDSAVVGKLGELVANQNEEATALYTKYAGGDTAAITEYVTMAGKLITVESLLSADVAYIQGSQSLIQGIDSALDSENGELMTGMLSLQSNYKTFDEGIQTMISSMNTLVNNLSELKSGINTLTENYDTLDEGVNEYTDAVEAIFEGYEKITDGAYKMVDATTSLYDGTKTLTEGTGEFVDEADNMQDEVDTKIDEMLDEYKGTDYETQSFVSDKNSNVNSVQFVIKAQAIEKVEAETIENDQTQNLNIWQKFLKLFGL
jgi:putative membrane protein